MRATSALSLEAGISTVSCAAWIALRMRVRKSAIGSVMDMGCSDLKWFSKRCRVYQEDFVMPGIWPLWASSRRQMRQSPNLRYTECGRPQRLQRVYARVLNFGG